MQRADYAPSTMADVKPLTKHLGPLGKPEEGGMDRSEASRKGAVVKRMVESEGWAVLLELIEDLGRHEQKLMMKSLPKDDNSSKERDIGRWRGREDILALTEGIIRHGEQASQEMESGQAAEAG